MVSIGGLGKLLISPLTRLRGYRRCLHGATVYFSRSASSKLWPCPPVQGSVMVAFLYIISIATYGSVQGQLGTVSPDVKAGFCLLPAACLVGSLANCRRCVSPNSQEKRGFDSVLTIPCLLVNLVTSLTFIFFSTSGLTLLPWVSNWGVVQPGVTFMNPFHWPIRSLLAKWLAF